MRTMIKTMMTITTMGLMTMGTVSAQTETESTVATSAIDVDENTIVTEHTDYAETVKGLAKDDYERPEDKKLFIPLDEMETADEDATNDEIVDAKKYRNTDAWNYDEQLPEGTVTETKPDVEYDTISFSPYSDYHNKSDMIQQQATDQVEGMELYVPENEPQEAVASDYTDYVEYEYKTLIDVGSIMVSYNEVDFENYLAEKLKNVDRSNIAFMSRPVNGIVYIITADGDYKYIDQKEIVGSEDLVATLQNGKPITAQTFYYETSKIGLLTGLSSARSFMQMKVEQQQSLMNPFFDNSKKRNVDVSIDVIY